MGVLAGIKRTHNTVRLRDITGQESGIIVYKDGTAIVANWGAEEGLPKIAYDGALIYMPTEAKQTNFRDTINISQWIDMSTLVVIHDANNDLPLDKDTYGTITTLTDGTVVLAPDQWN